MKGPWLSIGRLRQMVRKELRQALRDPRSRRILFVAPVVQLLIFGYAVTTDVRNTKTFVVDHDRSTQSRELVSALTAGGYFRVIGRSTRSADLPAALDRGDALVGLEIPHGFAADLASGRQASLQLLLDGSTSNTANVAHGNAMRIIARFAAEHGNDVASRAGSEVPAATGGVDFRARAWFNPDLASRVYNVPGVIGTVTMLMSLLLTSLAVVREREIGTLEQLMVSPLRPSELILGKTLPVVLIAFVDLALITTIALFWFHVPFRGSFPLLLVASLAYILTGLGIGLFISTVSSTQQEAFMSMFFFLLPAILLSGFMFPIESMPVVLQYLTLLDPLRHFLVVVRGIFLRGAGWQVLHREILVLMAMGVTVLWIATTRFRKTSG